jgi:acetyl esterase/lipase
MAAPYWEDVEGHLESSPANFIPDFETPVLLMHGDSDGVVDFYQGLEFYNYARKAGKEVVLFVYPGAAHGLSDESQQVDYHRPILQRFGHHLKGEPLAQWITDGESWSARERDARADQHCAVQTRYLEVGDGLTCRVRESQASSRLPP